MNKAEYMREYHATHKEQEQKTSARYYEKNREIILAKRKQTYQANRDERRKKALEYYHAHKSMSSHHSHKGI